MDEQTRNYVVSLAMKFIGTPYIWGGSNPNVGFDCSGFVIWIYQVFGLLPSGDWTANDLLAECVETFQIQNPEIPHNVGTLVFYGKRDVYKFVDASHVGIYDGLGNVISASGGNSKTLTVEDAKKRNAMVKIKPVAYRNDFICYGRLK